MNKNHHGSGSVRVAGIFDDRERATRFVESLVEDNYPMDQFSLLHKGGGNGDDPLGIVYAGEKERIKVWGEQGLLWGALGGLLAGLSGVFLVPGVGAVLAAGPVVEALVGAIAGGGLMAGAAVASSIPAAFRRLGLPEEKLDELEQAIQNGQYVLLLHSDEADAAQLENRLRLLGATVLEL